MAQKMKKSDIKYKYLDGQVYREKNKAWRVSRLIFLSQNFKPFNIPMKALNIYDLFPVSKNTMDFIKHMKKVLDSDLSYPIILDDEGYIMDGRHRILKALFEGVKTIKAVRFDKTPPCCYITDDK